MTGHFTSYKHRANHELATTAFKGLEASAETGQIRRMTRRDPRRHPPIIEMRIDGSFPPPRGPSLPMKIAGIALAVATLAGSLALAALVLWLVLWAVLILVPLALLGGVVAWAAYRYQVWKRGDLFGGPRDVFRRR